MVAREQAHRQDLIGGEVAKHSRDGHEAERRESAREELDVVGLPAVVGLRQNLGLELVDRGLGQVTGRLRRPRDRAEPGKVVLDRLLDARVLHLDGDRSPVRLTARWTCPRDAAANGSRSNSLERRPPALGPRLPANWARISDGCMPGASR